MKRLCDEALSADAARILRSAEGDAPSSPEEQHARIIEAYRIATPALLASNPWRHRKWAVLAGTLVIASALVVVWSSTRGSAAPPAAVATNTELPRAPFAPSIAQVSDKSEPTVRVEDLPAAPVAVSAPRPAPAVAEDELAAIDASRSALRTGHPDEALVRIAKWHKTFPHPVYAEEADALEVQALVAAGRIDEARAKAALFFRAHPDSAYEQRIRATIAESQP